jgi:hypothetical protein
MALTTVQSGILGDSTQTYGMKNRIINGDMRIDQRNAGASVTPSATATNVYTVDRWFYYQSQASKFAVDQNAGSITPPSGFGHYLGLTSQSAYSITSSDYFGIGQIIEGFNTTDLAWGTANAATITLSFRVYSSLTGTFGGSIQTADQSRSYPFTYTIGSANTWTTVAVTIPGDTGGTWVGASASGSVRVNFGLGMGSTFSGTAGAWATANYISATGATSVVGTNGATFYITGVQFEKGSTATQFDYRPFGAELQLCQRYYQTTGSITGVGANSTTFQGFVTYAVQMRIVNPAFALNAVMRITDGYASNITMSSLSAGYSINQSSPNLQYVQFNNFSGLTQGRFYGFYANANTDVATLSAEL